MHSKVSYLTLQSQKEKTISEIGRMGTNVSYMDSSQELKNIESSDSNNRRAVVTERGLAESGVSTHLKKENSFSL
jgi:hypothetical protein